MVVALVATLAAGCGDDLPPLAPGSSTGSTGIGSGTADDTGEPFDPVPESIDPSGLRVRLVTVAIAPSTDPDPAGSLRGRARIGHLEADPLDRIVYNDQRGLLYRLEGDQSTIYLDVAAEFPAFSDEQGLGSGMNSFTIHPEFAVDGRLYTVHSEVPAGETVDLPAPVLYPAFYQYVLTEWTADDPQAETFVGSHRELLRTDGPTHLHGVQQVAFNPTAGPGDDDYGLLYVSFGDGGGYPNPNAGRTDSTYGTILRIDPDGTDSSNGAYGIPPSNPFVDDPDPATRHEIWAYGFRNPHRFSWDLQGQHIMLIGDIGQNNIEELDRGIAGAHYGWSAREGTFVIDPLDPEHIFELPPDDELLGYTYPVAQYDHDEGRAIAAGYVYRGAAIPELFGHYVFGDVVSGRLFHLPVDTLVDGAQAPIFELEVLDEAGEPLDLLQEIGGEHDRVDIRFGLDAEDELYVTSKTDGAIRRVEAS